MQSMHSPGIEATARLPPITRDRLCEAFTTLPDPRRPHGRRFPRAAMLAQAIIALLANHLSLLAIAQWGKRQSPAVLAALGFPTGVTPHHTTRHRLFRKLDPLPRAVALTDCFAPARSPDRDPQGRVGIAFDGKAHRGRLACADHAEYPVPMLSAVMHDRGIVLAQGMPSLATPGALWAAGARRWQRRAASTC